MSSFPFESLFLFVLWVAVRNIPFNAEKICSQTGFEDMLLRMLGNEKLHFHSQHLKPSVSVSQVSSAFSTHLRFFSVRVDSVHVQADGLHFTTCKDVCIINVMFANKDTIISEHGGWGLTVGHRRQLQHGVQRALQVRQLLWKHKWMDHRQTLCSISTQTCINVLNPSCSSSKSDYSLEQFHPCLTLDLLSFISCKIH